MKLFFDEKGTTIAEAVMAVVVTLAAAVVLYQAFAYGMEYMAETAHRRLALALADSEMNKWEILVSQEGLTNVPRNRVKCVVDHRDLKTKRDDLEGYIEYGELELMTETIGEQPVQSYYKFWVRVSWYENNEDTPEFVQLISYFPKKE